MSRSAKLPALKLFSFDSKYFSLFRKSDKQDEYGGEIGGNFSCGLSLLTWYSAFYSFPCPSFPLRPQYGSECSGILASIHITWWWAIVYRTYIYVLKIWWATQILTLYSFGSMASGVSMCFHYRYEAVMSAVKFDSNVWFVHFLNEIFFCRERAELFLSVVQ